MARLRMQQIEAALICIGGLLLVLEICNAVRANVWWIDRSVLTEKRFAFYLWSGVGLGILFVVEGIAAIRRSEASIEFVSLQGPLMLVLVPAFILIAHGWRIRTDVAPADSITALSDLPIAIRALAEPWLTGGLIVLVALGAGLSTVHVLRRRTYPKQG